MHISIKQRILAILLLESKTITIILGVLGMLFGTGMLLLDSNSKDYLALLYLFNSELWGIIFIGYALLKLYQVFYPVAGNIKVVGSTLGMWLWTYVLIAFLFMDANTLTPAELMLFTPLILEILELVIDLFQCRSKGESI